MLCQVIGMRCLAVHVPRLSCPLPPMTDRAAELMTRTGPVVQLEVAKQGAIHQGLASLLCQPSPLLLQRGGGRLSERDIPGRLAHDEPPPPLRSIQGSKSVPALNCECRLGWEGRVRSGSKAVQSQQVTARLPRQPNPCHL